VLPLARQRHAQLAWLDGRHSFSFGEYHDPAQRHFRTLRVINEDRVAPGGGFDTHGHRDMEIITRHMLGLGLPVAIIPPLQPFGIVGATLLYLVDDGKE
jgi:hypothetical protein